MDLIEFKRVFTESVISDLLKIDVRNLKVTNSHISYNSDGSNSTISISDFEKHVVKKSLQDSIPSGYKIEITHDNDTFMRYKCNIIARKTHSSIFYSYGKNESVAIYKCICGLKENVTIATETEHDYRASIK